MRATSLQKTVLFLSLTGLALPVEAAPPGAAFEELRAARQNSRQAPSILATPLRVLFAQEAHIHRETVPSGFVSQAEINTISTGLIHRDAAGLVGVRVQADNVADVTPFLESIGAVRLHKAKGFEFVECFVPAASLPALGDSSPRGVHAVTPIYEPVLDTGSVTSQADVLHEAVRVRAFTPSFTGAGQRVGVLSDSFDNLGGAGLGIGSGNLPLTLIYVEDLASGGTDEGRAMIEIVHDIAPDAAKAFATAFGGEAAFAANITDLADPTLGDCNIIVDDVVYFFEPFFQDGIVAQAADDAFTDHDVMYFTSAGNRARRAYESTAFAPASDPFIGVDCHDFDTTAGTDTRQLITMPAGSIARFAFQWDDPWYTISGVDTDLDLYLLSTDGLDTVLASSLDDNIALQSPAEFIDFTNTTGGTLTVNLVIQKFAGPDPGRIKYVNFGSSTLTLEHATLSATVNPHAAGKNLAGVAATNYFDQEGIATFSSRGPSVFHFEPDGTPLVATEIRDTPRFSAIQACNTSFFGSDFDGDGFPNFSGTSAAAPHAAGIAALMRDAFPAEDATTLFTKLDDSARDLFAAGYDEDSGLGVINAWRAIFSDAIPVSPPFMEGFETGVLSTMWETRTLGATAVQVTPMHTPPVGSFHMTLDQGLAMVSSFRAEATLHLDLSGVSGTTLLFLQKEYADEDTPMPPVFTDFSDSDGVAFSVDGGVTWYSLVSLVGPASLPVPTPYAFDLDVEAASHSVTLGSDVRIRFQQFDTGPIPTDGFSFDEIVITSSVLWVDLISLTATADAAGSPVQVRWETATETDNIGFNVYRADEIGNSWQRGARMNPTLIPSGGSPTMGSVYEFWDSEPFDPSAGPRGYILEDVDTAGTIRVHGPVFVPDPSAATGVGDWMVY